MSDFSFAQAANALFAALDLDVSLAAEEGVEVFAAGLLGSGMTARQVTLVNHIPPAGIGQVGFLINLGEEHWLPVIGSGYEAFILAADGSKLRALETSDLSGVTKAWSLHRNVASVSQLRSFFHQHKARLLEIFTCSIIINLFALLLPLFSSFVYDKILGNGITATLWGLVIGLGIVMVVEFCMRVIRTMMAERFSIASETDIDHGMFHNLLASKINKMPSIGALLEKYKQVLSYRDFLSSTYLLALADLPFLFLFLLVIALVSGPLVFIPILCGTAMLLVSAFFTLPVLTYDRQSRQSSAQRMGLITDVLSAREVIIGSALSNELARRWRQASVTSTTASSLARYWRGFGMTVIGSLSSISYIAVIVGGVYMVEDRTLTSGGLLAASMLTSRTMGNVASLITLIIRYREFRTAMQELNLILPASAPAAHHESRGRLRGDLRFDKVSCRLTPDSQPILNAVSLHIKAGEMVGIAGAPGAGKTTLLRLMAGVLQPSEGQILIDDTPIDNLSAEDMTWNIGFKPQDFCLFDGTIEENVRAGRTQMPAELRQEILTVSGLARSFKESGLNWATPVGSRGSNLSGGQRQLVALARALLYDPSLLLLDEPTNGLDAELEMHLVQQLVQRKGKCTILVSAHNRNMLAVCDRIIVIGQSRILADGPTDKVLAR